MDDRLARTRVLTRTQARPDEGARVRSPAVVANEAQQLPCLRLRGPSLTLSLRPLPPQVRRNHGPGKGCGEPSGAAVRVLCLGPQPGGGRWNRPVRIRPPKLLPSQPSTPGP